MVCPCTDDKSVINDTVRLRHPGQRRDSYSIFGFLSALNSVEDDDISSVDLFDADLLSQALITPALADDLPGFASFLLHITTVATDIDCVSSEARLTLKSI